MLFEVSQKHYSNNAISLRAGKKAVSIILLVALGYFFCCCCHAFAKYSAVQRAYIVKHDKENRDNKTERWQNKHIFSLTWCTILWEEQFLVFIVKRKTKNKHKQKHENKTMYKQKTCQDENNAWVPTQVIHRIGRRQCILESPHCKLKQLFTLHCPWWLVPLLDV